MNTELSSIYDWLNANKLSLNIDKSKYIIFHAHQKSRFIDKSICKIFIDDQEIDNVETFCFLGVHLHQNLSWNTHLKLTSQKLARTLGIMKFMKKFVNSSTLLLLYNSLFLPHINYGILSWGTSKGYHFERISKLQKAAVRLISSSNFRSHHEPICKKLNLLKLGDIYDLRCYKLLIMWHRNLLPRPIQNMFHSVSQTNLRSHRFGNNFVTPRYRLSSSQCHLSLSACALWNSLPEKFKSTLNYSTKSLKKHILDSYSAT